MLSKTPRKLSSKEPTRQTKRLPKIVRAHRNRITLSKRNKRLVSFSKKTYFYVGGIVMIMLFVGFGTNKTNSNTKISSEEKINTPNKLLYPTQYSDKNINTHAILTEPRVSKIVMSNSSILSSQFASIYNSIKKIPATNLNIDKKEYGTWIWTPILEMTPSYINTIVSNSKNNGINVIYLSLDSYLDIIALPTNTDEKEKKEKLDKFNSNVSLFIKTAHKVGIDVDAEGGWRNWAEPGNTYKAFALLDYVKTYNTTATNKFRGFQYDIEPYMLANYEKNQKLIYTHFLDLIDDTIKSLTKTDLLFTVTIPDFYEGSKKWTPSFYYNDKKAYTYEHLLDILEKRPNSNIIIMAYRNFATGDDSTVDISEEELSIAKKYSTKIIIAQETGEVNPAYLTFFNTTKKYYLNEHNEVKDYFKDSKNFGGTAVHFVNAFMTLK